MNDQIALSHNSLKSDKQKTSEPWLRNQWQIQPYKWILFKQ